MFHQDYASFLRRGQHREHQIPTVVSTRLQSQGYNSDQFVSQQRVQPGHIQHVQPEFHLNRESFQQDGCSDDVCNFYDNGHTVDHITSVNEQRNLQARNFTSTSVPIPSRNQTIGRFYNQGRRPLWYKGNSAQSFESIGRSTKLRSCQEVKQWQVRPLQVAGRRSRPQSGRHYHSFERRAMCPETEGSRSRPQSDSHYYPFECGLPQGKGNMESSQSCSPVYPFENKIRPPHSDGNYRRLQTGSLNYPYKKQMKSSQDKTSKHRSQCGSLNFPFAKRMNSPLNLKTESADAHEKESLEGSSTTKSRSPVKKTASLVIKRKSPSVSPKKSANRIKTVVTVEVQNFQELSEGTATNHGEEITIDHNLTTKVIVNVDEADHLKKMIAIKKNTDYTKENPTPLKSTELKIIEDSSLKRNTQMSDIDSRPKTMARNVSISQKEIEEITRQVENINTQTSEKDVSDQEFQSKAVAVNTGENKDALSITKTNENEVGGITSSQDVGLYILKCDGKEKQTDTKENFCENMEEEQSCSNEMIDKQSVPKDVKNDIEKHDDINVKVGDLKVQRIGLVEQVPTNIAKNDMKLEKSDSLSRVTVAKDTHCLEEGKIQNTESEEDPLSEDPLALPLVSDVFLETGVTCNLANERCDHTWSESHYSDTDVAVKDLTSDAYHGVQLNQDPKLKLFPVVRLDNICESQKITEKSGSPKVTRILAGCEKLGVDKKSPLQEKVLRIHLDRCDSPLFKDNEGKRVKFYAKNGITEDNSENKESDTTREIKDNDIERFEGKFAERNDLEEMDTTISNTDNAENNINIMTDSRRTLSERFSEYNRDAEEDLEEKMEVEIDDSDLGEINNKTDTALSVEARMSLSDRFSTITNKGTDKSALTESTKTGRVANDNSKNNEETKDSIETKNKGGTSNEKLNSIEVIQGKNEQKTKESEKPNKDKLKETGVQSHLENDSKSGKEMTHSETPVVDVTNSRGATQVSPTSHGRVIKNTVASPTSFLDDDNEDDDESEDDDLLDTAPAFLRSIKEITERPLPATPEKDIDCSLRSLSDSIDETALNYYSPLDTRKRIITKPSAKQSKFTLDGLLAEHADNEDHEREMNEIKTELTNDIKQGGFVTILNKEEETPEDCPLPEDLQQKLRHYHNQESQISDDRPGTLVFHKDRYLCLFDGNLHPTHCGFTASGNSTIEKHLATVTTDQYVTLLTSDIIQMCFSRIKCQGALLRWLLCLMSVHEDYLVRQSCQKVLLAVLRKQRATTDQTWSPGLVDIISIMVNYGADVEMLIPQGLAVPEIIRQKLQHQPNYERPPAHVNNNGYQKDSLALVLQVLAQSLNGKSGRYNAGDLTVLLAILLKASLDTSIKHLFALDLFTNCVAMVVKEYTDADWSEQRLHLSRVVAGLADQHQNRVHVVQLLPPGSRGAYVQRRASYLVLLDVLMDNTPVSDDQLNHLKIADLYKCVPPMKDLLIDDPYKLSSIVSLLDLCVGVNDMLKTSEREELKILVDQVKRLRARDNVSMLDRTRVKDMLVRLTSSWILDIQTMKGKQTKIFEYAVQHNSPAQIKIETIKTDSFDVDSSCSEDENGTPRKLPKL